MPSIVWPFVSGNSFGADHSAEFVGAIRARYRLILGPGPSGINQAVE